MFSFIINKRISKFNFILFCITFLFIILVITPLLLFFFIPIENNVNSSVVDLNDYIFDSLILAFLTPLIAIFFALPQAFITTNFDFPFRRTFVFFAITPLSFPAYIAAFCYKEIFEYKGFFFSFIPGFENYFFDLMNVYGAVFIFAVTLSPYLYISLRSSFISSVQLAENSLTLNKAINFRYFFLVALPIAKPFLFSSLFLISIETFNNYTVAHYFGLQTIPVAFFRFWVDYNDFAYSMKIALSILALFFIVIIPLKKIYDDQKYSPKPKPISLRKVRGWKLAIVYFVLFVPIFFGFLFPLIQIFKWVTILSVDFLPSLDSFFNSLFLSFVIPLIAFVITMIFSLGIISIPPVRPSQFFNALLSFYYIAPSILIALPLLFIFPLPSNSLLLIFTLTFKFLPLNTFIIQSHLISLNPSIFYSSRSLGVSPFKTVFRIIIPLSVPAICAAACFTILEVVKELPLTLMLSPFNFHTLSTRVFQLVFEGRIIESAMPSLILIIVGFFVTLALYFFSEKLSSYYLYSRKT